MLSASPSPEAINGQLRRILASEDFQASARLKRLLEFLVLETLEGRGDDLKAYTIALAVFGRDSSFDPQVDPTVRVEAGKLRSKLERYYYINNDDPIRIDVPKGRYVPSFTANAGLEVSTEGPEIEIETRGMAQRGNEAVSNTPSVAVLPFVNIGNNIEIEYFAEGLTEEITVSLTRFDDLIIANSYTSRQFKSAPQDIMEVARILGVRFVLHGSVQIGGNALRVFATLTDAATGSNLWAEKFEGQLAAEELFSIQDEITQHVVARLADNYGFIKRTLLKESSIKRTDDLEVYDAILRYGQWAASFNPELFTRARAALERAVTIEPDYALPVAMLSDMYSSDYQQGYDQVDKPLENAVRLANRALDLDANCQTAYWALAQYYFLKRELGQFEYVAKKILPLNPVNPYMNVSVGLLTAMAGDLEGGLELMHKAVQLNPYSPRWYRIVPYMIAYKRGDYEAALAEALQLNIPSCLWDPMLRAAAYGRLGRREEGRAALAELLAVQPSFAADRLRFMRALLFSDETVGEISTGLAAAGLEFQ